MINRFSINLYLLLLLLSASKIVTAANNTITGTLEHYATIYSIGVEWDITGDDNHNASVQVKYRKTGTDSWKDAQALFRVDFQGYNMLAGSIFFLEPATEYEISLVLSDPDGGNQSQVITQSTRNIPTLPNGNQYHVIVGTGGGDGTVANPFKGIIAAQSQAQAGDIFLLHAGDYGTAGEVYFNKAGSFNNPIVWKSAGDGRVVLNKARIAADYIWLDGLNFEYDESNSDFGLLTTSPGPVGAILTNNYFFNCNKCIYLNQGGSNWYIVNNTIVGNNDPNTGSNFTGEGIELNRTSGHTVAYNTISKVADGISYPRSNVDIFNNEIFDTTDDGIELDYGHNNVRVWRNRISNAFNNGISFQPMDGAPWYVLYNQVAAPGEDALKLRTRIDRVLLAHNTLVAWSGPISSSSILLRNMKSRNNLWISVQPRYIWENGGDSSLNWKTDLDYDGFDWGNYTYAFKWGQRLTHLSDFQSLTAEELNGIVIDRNSCFEEFNIPGPPPLAIPFQHISLTSSCNAIDAAEYLPNINDDYFGTAPDMGALERGNLLPNYGNDIIYKNSFEYTFE